MAAVLDDPTIELLEQALLSFAKLDDATAFAGLHRGTFWRWRRRAAELALVYRDEETPVHGPPTEEEARLLRLHDAVERSGPAAKARMLMEIRRAGLGVPVRVTTTTTTGTGDKAVTKVVVVERTERSWQALAWLLERNHPDEFALVNRQEHSLGAGFVTPEGEEADALLEMGYGLIDQIAERRRLNEQREEAVGQ